MPHIYKITNLTNNKCYIGACITTVKNRWKRHLSAAKDEHSRQALHSAIRKYGKENFKVETLYTHPDRDFIFRFCEPLFIIGCESHGSAKGYNQTFGGDGGWFGMRHSKESKQKISEANTGRPKTIETRKKLSDAAKGKDTWNKGITCPQISEAKRGVLHNDGSKANMAASHLGFKHSEEAKNITRDKISEKFTIEDPNGTVISDSNLRKFCKEMNLSQGNLLTHGHTKGYRLISVTRKVRTYTIQEINTKETFKVNNLKEFCKKRKISNAGLLGKFKINKPYINYQILNFSCAEEVHDYK